MPSASGRMLPPLLQKACPIVLREGGRGAEILVYSHRGAGTRLVTGIMAPREAPEAAAIRELREASGLKGRRAEGPSRRVTPVEAECWHLVPCVAPGAPDNWIHAASRRGGGRLVRFRWLPVEGPFPGDMEAASACALAAFAPSGA